MNSVLEVKFLNIVTFLAILAKILNELQLFIFVLSIDYVKNNVLSCTKKSIKNMNCLT